MFYSHLKGHIEALLFANGEPISASKIAAILDMPVEQVELLIAQLSRDYEDNTRGLTIVEIAGGYQLCTKPVYAETIQKLTTIQDSKLSVAAMETLAIIAFKQPITRQEIESIRGVKADRVITTLLERSLIREVGRKEVIGRPILYGTTDEFLICFGLKTLDDLPDLSELILEKQS